MERDSKLFVYNTLSRSKEEFAPISYGKVNMFVCGQTVYDDAHLGHAKTYIDFDIVARWLRHLGYDLTYVQNITDIDDKIIARAREKDVEAKELARFYEKRFMQDMESIDVKRSVNLYPRSHDYVESMREQIQLLLDKEYAYCLDGDIYFDVLKFKDYTRLSRMRIEELERHRIEVREGKKAPYDFAVWKASKPGEPSWKIKIVYNKKEIEMEGRPGWHIEDTAIAYALFGPQYDLHGGANELIFPHHTNEIAQAEAASGKKPFVKYWLHSGILSIKGEKMSKSLKNFITIREALSRYSGEAIRLMAASTHYRKEITYTESLMKNAADRLNYLYSSFSIFCNIRTASSTRQDSIISLLVKEFGQDFTNAMNDDLNTPLALAALHEVISELRRFSETHEVLGRKAKEEAIKRVVGLANALGILQNERFRMAPPDEALGLISMRERLRKEGHFEEADEIRSNLKNEYKIIVEDTEYGTVWYGAE